MGRSQAQQPMPHKVRSGPAWMIPQTEPHSALHPVDQGRQQADRPDRRFCPRLPRTDLSALCSRKPLWLLRHSHRLMFRWPVHAASTFLRPFAPRALPRFLAPMDALTPVGPRVSGVASVCSSLPVAPTRTTGQDCWGAAVLTPPLSRMHRLAPTGLPALTCTAVRPFRPHPPDCSRRRFATLPLSATGFLRHSQPQVWASPVPSRLASQPGRIGFLHVQTGRSPPVPPTPPRGDAVTFGFRPESACLERTFTSLTMHARRRARGRILCGPCRRGRQKMAPLHQQDWALLLLPNPVGARGRVRGIPSAGRVKFLGSDGNPLRGCVTERNFLFFPLPLGGEG